MNQEQAKQKIKESWQEILADWTGRAPADRNGAPTYICPICGNGSGGKDGDGVMFNPKSKGGLQLSCFNCTPEFHGDIIALYMRAHHMTDRDFPRALNELAQKIGITIDREDGGAKIHVDEILKNGKKEAPVMIQVATIEKDARTSPSGWKNESLDFSEFEKRFTKPRLAKIDRAGLAAKNEDNYKAEKGRAGGFVGGPLRNGYRSKDTLEGRSVWTGDIDDGPSTAALFATLQKGVALPFRAFVYSTFSHSPDAPRLRIVAPFSRMVSPDEYRPLATYIELKIAAGLKMPDLFDFHGAVPSQVMYLPFCPSDAAGDYFFKSYAGPVLDVDALIAERPTQEPVLKRVLGAGQSAENIAGDIAAARGNINDPEAIKYLNTRGLGIDKAGRIFAPELGLGFVLSRNGRKAASLLVATGPDSYFMREFRPESELTAKEKEYIKHAEGPRRLFNPLALYTGGPAYIVEGEIDALSIIEVGGNATGLGGTNMVAALVEQVKQARPTATLIIALDNDKGGRDAAKELKKALTELRVPWIERNAGGPFKDPNEFLQKDREGFYQAVVAFSDEARSFLPVKKEGEAPDAEADPGTEYIERVPRTALGLTSVAEFCADFSAGNWLVDRWIPAGGFSMLYGKPGSLKSFVAVDLALTLASDRVSWKGYQVRRLDPDAPPPLVVYLAGEGYSGLKARVLAWLKHYNETGADAEAEAAENTARDFGATPEEALAAANSVRRAYVPLTLNDLRDRLIFSKRAVDLFTKDGTGSVINEIKALGRPVEYVVIDTLARFFGGDENSATDAGQLISACGSIHNEFGAAVTLLHHSGVDENTQNRSRGSSAFLGALDTQIWIQARNEVQGDTTTPKLGVLKQTKQKDIDEAPALWVKVETIELPEFINPLTGRAITSAVVVPTDLRWKELQDKKGKPATREPLKPTDEMTAARDGLFD